MRRTPLTLTVVALAAALALPACGGDDDSDDIRGDLSDELQTSLDLDAEQADCFADVLVEEIGEEELQDIDFTAEEPPEGMQEQFAAAALVAVDDCDIDVSAFGG